MRPRSSKTAAPPPRCTGSREAGAAGGHRRLLPTSNEGRQPMTPSSLLELLARGRTRSAHPRSRRRTSRHSSLSKTLATRASTTTAACAQGCPKSSSPRAKPPQQTVDIFSSLAAGGVDVLVTRASTATAEAVLAKHPAAVSQPRSAHHLSAPDRAFRPIS